MNDNTKFINEIKDEIVKKYNTLQRLQSAELTLIQEMNELKRQVFELKGENQYHNCPYCSVHIVGGDNKLELCEVCAETLGHKYYNEL